jgi:LuxR family maltose regulon positive regulatory protein
MSSDAGLDAALAVLGGDTGTTVVIDRADRLMPDRLAILDAGVADRGPEAALIVAGRHDPQLQSADLELAGEDLAWSEPEVAEALRRWGGPMADADAESVAWLTEGWCVAVRLAAAAGVGVLLQEAGTLRQQLMREVAATASPELVAGAIRLAALDQFDADTIDTVLDPPGGGQAMLDELRRCRLFLRPLDEPGVWRFHRMFHQAAQQELRSQTRAAGSRWPRRATRDAAGVSRRFLSAYSAGPGLTDDMLDNGLLAAHAVELLLEGALQPPSAESLARVSTGTPLGRAAIGLAALSVGDLQGADVALEGAPEPRDAVAQGIADVTALLRERHCGALAGTVAAAERLADGDDHGRSALAWLELGTLEFDLGRYEDAEQHLHRAVASADRAGRSALAARAWAVLAQLAGNAGLLTLAEQRAAMADGDWVLPAESAVRAALARAGIGFYRDELADAARHVDVARTAAAATRDPVVWLYVVLAEVTVLDAQGHDALAGARLAEGVDLRARCPTALYHAGAFDLFRARMLDRAGRGREAAHVLDEIARRDYVGLDLALARRSLWAGDPAAAIAALQPHVEKSASGWEGLSCWHLILYAVAVDRAGDPKSAHEVLETALALAEPEGLRRPFVDEGIPARSLLRRHRERPTAHAGLIEDLLDHIEARRPAPQAELDSSLTERELVVLGYLPTELSAVDIAAVLTISETTVRTHLRHIYEKLSVGGRRDAVRRARELRLLSPQ